MSCGTFECILRSSTATGRVSDFEVYMSWFPSQNPKATGFRILRDNKILATLNQTITEYTDITINLENIHTYVLQELEIGKVVDQSDGKIIVTPTFNPFSYNATLYRMQPPINLGIVPLIVGDSTRYKIIWTEVAEAESYKIYRNERLIGTSTTNSFIIPNDFLSFSMFYFVTAINKDGIESFPSANVLGRFSASKIPMPEGQVDPCRDIIGYSEINNSKIRNVLSWSTFPQGNDDLNVQYWNIYRDGILKAEGMYLQYFIDDDVEPGKEYSYVIEGAIRRQGLVKTTSNPPYTIKTKSDTNLPPVGVVEILSVQPGDDTLKVKFKKYPGAVDYRVKILSRNVANDERIGGEYWTKYSGDNDLIQVNGVGPETTATMVIEAVDKFGPFVRMDGFDGPGHYITEAGSYSGGGHSHGDDESLPMGNHRYINAMEMVNAEVNGQGDPSNIPNVIAISAEFTGTTIPFEFTGEQQFFEPWRSVKEFKFVQADPEVIKKRAYPGLYARYFTIYENDKFELLLDECDQLRTQVFWMADHMMSTVYDGGTVPISNVSHNNNAILMIIAKQSANISGDKVLHSTFEVDPHLTNRRWIDMLFYDANDKLFGGQEPSTNLTSTNNTLRWIIKADGHILIQTKMVNGVFTEYRVNRNFPEYAKQRFNYIHKSRHHVAHNVKTKYKIGEFTITKLITGTATEPSSFIVRHNFFAADNRFTPITIDTTVSFNSLRNNGQCPLGLIFQKNFTPSLFNAQVEPMFMTTGRPTYVNYNLKYILDSFNNNVPYGLITYERKSGPNDNIVGVKGNIYYKPGPLDDNLTANKNAQWYDNRVRFDIYFSKNRVAICEDNYLINDATFPFELPFENIKVSWNHLVYHSGLELSENFRFKRGSNYHARYRPWADERHWDSMGYEVLTSFPELLAPDQTLDIY